MTELHSLSLTELTARIRSREVSPLEATEASLRRIEERDGELNSFLTVCADSAREEAAALTEELAHGRYRGPLHGVPIALKDLFLTRGVRTTAGSAILGDWVPEQDATVVRFLRQAGAISLGKLNMHEFAFGATNENPHYGPTRNPWDPTRLTGGSSGGSAAAVGGGLCYGALGSDTGGSIRCPAAVCGIVGLKPTYGRVSRSGVLPLSWSLDHVGPMTRTVTDAAVMLEAISGHDPADPSSSRRPVPPYARLVNEGVRELRIGIPREHFWGGLHDEVGEAVTRAVETLGKMCTDVRMVSIPSLERAPAVQNLILCAEAAAYHRERLRERSRDYSAGVRMRLLTGLFVEGTDYIQAQRARRVIRREFLECLRNVDVLLTPAVPIPAPLIGEEWVEVDGVRQPPQYFMVRNTYPFNLTGLPTISVPCGLAEGLPVGLQIAGRPWEESTVLRAARAWEEASGERIGVRG